MKPDQTPDDTLALPTVAPRGGLRGRHILFAGVAGACLLGAGLGLWARPAMSERQAAASLAAATAPSAAAARRTLQIVVGERPAPAGAPIDVLPASTPRAPLVPPLVRRPQTATVPPPSPPFVLTREVTPPAAPRPLIPPGVARLVAAAFAPRPAQPPQAAPGRLPPVQLARAAPVRRTPAKPSRMAELERAPRKAELAAAQAHKAQLAQAHAHKAELAKAAAARRIELARAARAAKQQLQLAAEARAEKQAKLQLAAAKAAKQEQLRLAAAKAEKQQLLRLAKAEAKGRAEALAEARAQAHAEARAEALAEARDDARKRMRLASLVRAVERAVPHRAAPHRAPPVELAKADRRHARRPRHEAQVEQASLRSRKPPRLAEPSVPLPRPSGLMKASAPRCANRDPGEALVCADASLGAADRQLARAYQGARAAGVSEAQLQRQQQRWLAARAAAAREAPWAVHDVYLARIAELNGQAREAHGDGY